MWYGVGMGLKKHDLKWLNEIAIKINAKSLSTEYINNQTKYRWKCLYCDHEWFATAKDVSNNHGCLKCSGKYPHDLNWLQDVAYKKQGKCLSTDYKSLKEKYCFECKLGHQWKATAYDIFHKNSWCPECAKGSTKDEDFIYELVKSIYPDTIRNQKGLLPNKRLEIDIYIPSLKKGIEFDGRYHDLEEQKERDLRKNKECLLVGIDLKRIYYKDWYKNKEKLIREIVQFINN